MRAQRWLLLTAVVTAGAIGLAVALQGSGRPQQLQPGSDLGDSMQRRDYHRIVSLAPSITECLFALGLGDRVVGVTDFCDYPPEALTRPKVGGYYDLNYEAIVALHPDLVVCLPEHHERLADLDRLGLAHLTVDHRRVTTILQSLTDLGRACGASERARVLVEGIQRRMEAVANRVIDGNRPRVLVCIGRNTDSTAVGSVYVAGRGRLYDEMVTLAGGINAYQGKLAFPLLTNEALLRLQPEVIIDMVPDISKKGLTEADILRQWAPLEDLQAVREGRVYVFDEDYVAIPGPRFIQVLEKMAAVIHPEGRSE